MRSSSRPNAEAVLAFPGGAAALPSRNAAHRTSSSHSAGCSPAMPGISRRLSSTRQLPSPTHGGGSLGEGGSPAAGSSARSSSHSASPNSPAPRPMPAATLKA